MLHITILINRGHFYECRANQWNHPSLQLAHSRYTTNTSYIHALPGLLFNLDRSKWTWWLKYYCNSSYLKYQLKFPYNLLPILLKLFIHMSCAMSTFLKLYILFSAYRSVGPHYFPFLVLVSLKQIIWRYFGNIILCIDDDERRIINCNQTFKSQFQRYFHISKSLW